MAVAVRPTTTDPIEAPPIARKRLEASVADFLAARPAFTEEMHDRITAALAPAVSDARRWEEAA